MGVQAFRILGFSGLKALPQPVTHFGAGCNTTRDPFRSGGSAQVGALVEFTTLTVAVTVTATLLPPPCRC
ncbi:hypothetical protein E2C01_024454 [Portunus trituberculatus]|uniref:Uncharacterized protein n=1 Tax=Portunus trituberculatus TaxID=210409 RepID=A0A5B7EAL6_PORTR|nr:hypothetical protein [Portunus trituberculatus]